jgi:hypothetical protein
VILLLVFGAGGLLISQLAYSYLIGDAQDEVQAQERLMMASARSVRKFGSSSRLRLSGSFESSQSKPIMANSTLHEATAAWIARK